MYKNWSYDLAISLWWKDLNTLFIIYQVLYIVTWQIALENVSSPIVCIVRSNKRFEKNARGEGRIKQEYKIN